MQHRLLSCLGAGEEEGHCLASLIFLVYLHFMVVFFPHQNYFFLLCNIRQKSETKSFFLVNV